MILDKNLRYCSEQAITSAAASEDVLDMANLTYLAEGKPVYLVLDVTETFDDTGDDSTLTVSLEGATDAAFTTVAEADDLFTLDALTADDSKIISYPLGNNVGALNANSAFTRLKFTPTNGDLSAGKITAYLSDVPVGQFIAHKTNIEIK